MQLKVMIPSIRYWRRHECNAEPGRFVCLHRKARASSVLDEAFLLGSTVSTRVQQLMVLSSGQHLVHKANANFFRREGGIVMRKIVVSSLVMLVAVMTIAVVARAKEIERTLDFEPDTVVVYTRYFCGGTIILQGEPHAAEPVGPGWGNGKMWTWDAAGFNGTAHSGLFMDGWKGVDNSVQMTPYFRVASSTGFPNDNIGTCVISGNKSLFCGATTSQAASLCYVDQIGTGYGNSWSQTVVTPQYTFNADEQIDLSYAYNNDGEPGYDFTRVTLQIYDWWQFAWVDYGTLAEYTGLISGSETIDVDSYMSSLTPPVDFRIGFTFTSDGGYSDEDGTFLTACGGLEIDDYSLAWSGGPIDIEDFEGVADGGLPSGWSHEYTGCGDYAMVRHLNDLPVGLDQDPCVSVIGPAWSGIKDSVLVFYDPVTPGYPHPICQNNFAQSPIIDLSSHPELHGRSLQCEMFGSLPLMDYIFMYWQVRYTPGCESGGWSPWANDNYIYYTSESMSCRPMEFDVSAYVPPAAQQVQVGLGVLNYCDEDPWGVGGCTYSCNATPYFDNVTFAIYGSDVAPYISMRELDYFQDQFAEDGTLNPTSTADTRTSNYRGLLVPPIFGDTMSVRGAAHDMEVWLQFRIDPIGPRQPVTAPFFTTWFPTVQTGAWQEARMDTAEVTESAGIATRVSAGRYMSTFHEADFVRIANGLGEGTEILLNNLFVPGTRIEYFIKAKYIGSSDWFLLPDTTGGVYEEFEILPMYRDDGEGGLQWPCLIVVDHFGQRGNGRLEDFERNSHRIGQHLAANDYEFDTFSKMGATSDLRNGIGRWAANAGQFGGPGVYEYNWGPGATPQQFLAYTHCMLNAGNVYDYCMYQEDVDMISSWLTDFSHAKFFWLSGDQVTRELDRRTLWGKSFLNNILGVTHIHKNYAGMTGGLDYCLPVNCVVGGSVPTNPFQYVIRMNGCPRNFNVIGVSGSAPGASAEKEYDAQSTKRYAAVSNTVSLVGGANFKTLTEGYDNCVMRDDDVLRFPACGADSVITTWFNAVLTWGGYGSTGLCSPVVVNVNPNTGGAPAVVTSLAQAYPNPMNPTATISYTVGTPGKVLLRVFDVTGRVIRTLVDEQKATGRYSVTWDGSSDRGEKAASGVFFYQLEGPGHKSAKKLVIIQ